MPIYEYRCECGAKLEALVRGREPGTGDEIGHLCDSGGKLTRLLSAFAVGSSSGSGASFSEACGPGEATCGSCGMTPGSCGWES